MPRFVDAHGFASAGAGHEPRDDRVALGFVDAHENLRFSPRGRGTSPGTTLSPLDLLTLTEIFDFLRGGGAIFETFITPHPALRADLSHKGRGEEYALRGNSSPTRGEVTSS